MCGSSENSGLVPQTKDIHARFTGGFKLAFSSAMD